MQGMFGLVRDVWNSGGAAVFGPRQQLTQSRIVDETPSASEEHTDLSDSDGDVEDDEGGKVKLQQPRFRFCVQQAKVNYASHEDYSESVLKWSSKAYFGRRLFKGGGKGVEPVSIGPYTIDEITEIVQQAADDAGFTIYLHKGLPWTKPDTIVRRISLKFQCDHGRVRYGADACHNVEFTKDLQDVVASTVMKSMKVRKNHGYKRTVTAHHRHKCVGCCFSFVICGTQDHVGLLNIDKSQPFMWSASTHKSCKATDEHINHVHRGTCTKMTEDVRQYLDKNSESGVSVPELVATIRRTFHVSLDYSRVRYYLLKQGSSVNPVGAGASRDGISGNSLATIQYLLKTKNSSVCLLLIHCQTGQWYTGDVSLLPNGAINLTTSLYTDHDESWKPCPLLRPDVDRIVHGTKSQEAYFVHTMAWNYHDEAKKFEAYPYTLAMDVQANVNRSTPGFNAIGTDGNYHNIVVMRAFIGSQSAETFRWIFKVAFLILIMNFRNIRAFFVDGWAATLSELQALCHASGMFPLAKIVLCMWHLLTDAYDRKFGFGKSATWFVEFKKLLYRLRRCELQPEFDDCSEYVLRRAAYTPPQDGDTVPFPSTEMVKFIMARVNHPRDWVMLHTLTTVTRGKMTTANCEGDQGHSRNRNIDGRNSWKTSAMKHEAMHLEKSIKLKHWIDKQISRKLLRGPTNASQSTITPEILSALDAIMLPWTVDEFEVQLLLSVNYEVKYTEFSTTKAVFKVFCDADRDSDNDDSEQRSCEINVAHHDSSESSSDSDKNGEKRTRSDSRDDEEEARVICEFDETMAPELQRVLANPLPCDKKFIWKKIRIVTINLDTEDPLMTISCSCGFPQRIGFACRHILRVIVLVLMMSRDSTESAFAWSDFPDLKFADLVNMDICSKMRYHGVLHCRDKAGKKGVMPDAAHAGSFFSLEHKRSFCPSVPASYVRAFLVRIDPDGEDDVPLPGLPRRQHSDVTEDATDNPPEPSSPRRSSARKAQPTERGVFDQLQRIWDQTKRLKDTNQGASRIFLQEHLDAVEDYINTMHPSKLPHKLTRYFSSSDMMKGRQRK